MCARSELIMNRIAMFGVSFAIPLLSPLPRRGLRIPAVEGRRSVRCARARGPNREFRLNTSAERWAIMTNPFSLSRVFRFIQDGHAQITNFPDSDPSGASDLEIRLKHFTEIENFTFLAYVLAHELAGPARAFSSALANLEVPDREFQGFVNTLTAPGLLVTDEQLGDTILDVGINWEHFVATFNNILIPG